MSSTSTHQMHWSCRPDRLSKVSVQEHKLLGILRWIMLRLMKQFMLTNIQQSEHYTICSMLCMCLDPGCLGLPQVSCPGHYLTPGIWPIMQHFAPPKYVFKGHITPPQLHPPPHKVIFWLCHDCLLWTIV